PGRGIADIEGARPVAVPAVDDRAGVDRDDLAGLDRAVAGDAVDDLVVDRDADAGRERPLGVDAWVALERRRAACRPDVGLGQGVEVRGRDARSQLGLDLVEDLGDDAAGTTHALDLGAGLAGGHGQTGPGAPAADV